MRTWFGHYPFVKNLVCNRFMIQRAVAKSNGSLPFEAEILPIRAIGWLFRHRYDMIKSQEVAK